MMFLRILLAVLFCLMSPHAFAAEKAVGKTGGDDPLEGFNRAMFSLNEGLDAVILRPLAQGYRFILPEPVRDSVRNLYDNYSSPVTFVNQVLQGNVSGAGTTTARVVINTLFGFFGAFDTAATFGLEPQKEDFGQTLAVWGVGSGPYLVLPVFGPSSPRDAIGRIADLFMDPWTYAAHNSNNDGALMGAKAVSAVDRRERNLERIAELKKDSLDFYTTIKSLYIQNVAAEVRNQSAGETRGGIYPNFEFDSNH